MPRRVWSRLECSDSRDWSGVAAVVAALVEPTAPGGCAAIRRGAGPLGTTVSAAIAAALGLVIVLLKALVH